MANTKKTIIATPYRRHVEDDEPTEQNDPNTQTEDDKDTTATSDDNQSTDEDNQDDASDDDSTTDQSPADAEEKVWKKRYDDARRHHNKLVAEKKDLQDQLAKASESGQMPVSQDATEITNWCKANPDVVKVIQSIAKDTVTVTSADVKTKLQQIETAQAQLIYDRAYTEILKTHTDFNELKNTANFLEWLELQPTIVKAALYENTSDHVSAIRAIDLYKYDKAKLAKPKSTAKDAARVVEASTTKEINDKSPKVWTNAEIESLSEHEYDKHEKDIKLAQAEGRIVK